VSSVSVRLTPADAFYLWTLIPLNDGKQALRCYDAIYEALEGLLDRSNLGTGVSHTRGPSTAVSPRMCMYCWSTYHLTKDCALQ
jgi:hypothetical protein